MAVEREVIVEASDTLQGMKISWGGVFGGVLAGVGALILLSSLGLAVGVSSARGADSETIGRGAAIWTGISLLISLFIGGWASTRLSLMWERTTAMFEGVLVWVLSLIIVLYLTASGVELVSGDGFGVAGQAAADAAQVQQSVSATAWVSFIALVLSLLAAIAGAAAGRRGVERKVGP
ncbi:MAG TPA: hypothetical protein VG994_12775 [Steroidobacteraceae bacterium]|nr:hypothetical protein [Steroidobacteraceae bacterium]